MKWSEVDEDNVAAVAWINPNYAVQLAVLFSERAVGIARSVPEKIEEIVESLLRFDKIEVAEMVGAEFMLDEFPAGLGICVEKTKPAEVVAPAPKRNDVPFTPGLV